jgi:hypothetical protein
MRNLPLWPLGIVAAILVVNGPWSGASSQSPATPPGSISPATNTTNLNANIVGKDSKAAKIEFSENTALIANNAVGSVYSIVVFVRNEESVPLHISFSATLQTQMGDPANAAITPRAWDGTIAGNTTKAIPLDIDIGKEQAPLSGYLRLASDSTASATSAYKYRPIQIVAPLPSPPSTSVVLWSLGVALVVVLISIVRLPMNGVALNHLMGQPTWNFTDSWGSNITIGAGLLTTLLQFAALPEYTHFMNKTAYLSLNLLFAGLITLAPLAYNLLRTPVLTTDSAGKPITVYCGYAFLFVIAGGVTVWGALGQLLTVSYLIRELAQVRVIAMGSMLSFNIVLGLVIILFFIYGCRTIVQVAVAQSQQKKNLESQHAARIAAAAPGVTVEPPTMPTWSLL